MTEQEKNFNQVEARVSNLETKFEMFMKSHEEFKQEMLNRDNQRVADIREIRQDMKTMQAQLDAKIDGIGKHVQTLTVAAMVGVGTSVIAVVVLVGTTIYALLSH